MEQQEETKLVEIKEEQLKTILKNVHDTFNKGLKNGSYELEDNVWVLFQNIAVIFEQYTKLRSEYDKSQKAIEHSMEHKKLLSKANDM